MAKFYGIVGYAESKETVPGVWENGITERNYYGDVLKISKRSQAGEGLNDNLVINNKISVIADPFAYQNFQNMLYVKWMGASWKIKEVEVENPRLILTLGGVYNEQ